jgi:hypothetical protein
MTTDKDKKKKAPKRMDSQAMGKGRRPVDVSEFSNFELLWFDLSTKVREMY